MRREDIQRRSVAEDLEYFAEVWKDGVADPDLRRGSAILRRLLVDDGEGALQRYWRDLGFEDQPVILAPSIHTRVLSAGPQVTLATAGGAIVDGVEIAGYIRAWPPIDADTQPSETSQPLRAYLSSPSVIVRGHPVSRRELVRYFAHHLGGVHVSRKVMKKDADLVRLLDSIETLPTQTHLFGKDLLHFELMAIGQAIGNSQDCRRLAKDIRRQVDQGG